MVRLFFTRKNSSMFGATALKSVCHMWGYIFTTTKIHQWYTSDVRSREGARSSIQTKVRVWEPRWSNPGFYANPSCSRGFGNGLGGCLKWMKWTWMSRFGNIQTISNLGDFEPTKTMVHRAWPPHRPSLETGFTCYYPYWAWATARISRNAALAKRFILRISM